MSRHIVLVGGGHTHVQVLKSFAMKGENDARLTIVTPSSYATYSGMAPGVLAGQYELRDAQIDVRALAAAAGATFVADRAVLVDADSRRLHLAHRPDLSYDLLSFDIGSQPALRDRVARDAPTAMVKPIDVAVVEIERAFAQPAPAAGRRIVVVGAGAGGAEVALGLMARIRKEGGGSVTLVDRKAIPVAERHPRTSALIARALTDNGINFITEVDVDRVGSSGVHLDDGRLLEADLVVWATGASGPELFAQSHLPVDRRGFLLVGDDLRCIERPEIFAAGDCATLTSYPDLPKAGVYAVREGPVLTANLRAALHGGRLRTYSPQRRFLSLLNLGDGRAVASYGPFAMQGVLAARLKDFIDRRFIAIFSRPALDDRTMSGEMVPCGGCAAKMGADVLRGVLDRLEVPANDDVIVGIGDDAAVVATPPGKAAVLTADMFPPFAADMFLVGQVAATNAASDLYAMGAEGGVAVALACLPDDGRAAAELEQFLRGALDTFATLDIQLVGGHTVAGEQSLLGFSMHGWVDPDRILRNQGALPGDRLVLTKPLGTGVILAAASAGVADSDWVEAAHASMLRPNLNAMRLLRDHGVTACTDVTGFGLAGHLRELLTSGSVTANLDHDAIPALPGVMQLLAAGWRSSFHERVRGAESTSPADNPATALHYDPQTSGGLLATVPANRLASLQTACRAANESIWVIGEVLG